MSDLKERITAIIQTAMEGYEQHAQGICDWKYPPLAEDVADDILTEVSREVDF